MMEDPKKKKEEVNVKPIGEELDIIHVNDGYHMHNIAYTDSGLSMFSCPNCNLKVIVGKAKE
ncbi:MAG: hypothetical protein QXK24_02085 [Ignisphaera sp.]